MATTVVYPYAKLNLGLHVLEKRSDGFHNIQTLFYPHTLCDILEITDATAKGSKGAKLFLYGLPVMGDPQENLCIQAYDMLAEKHPMGPVEIHLYKKIPPGSGLGGGSSNAAFCLQLLDKHFALGLQAEELMAFATQLGSDVPFFMQDTPPKAFLAEGRGSVLEPFDMALDGYKIEVRFPPVFVSTAWAYKEVVPNTNKQPLEHVLKQPVETWKDVLVNDFERVVFKKHPQIQQYKEDLYREGAVYASMTGSGSAVFGLFK